jgi:hypothetical protein
MGLTTDWPRIGQFGQSELLNVMSRKTRAHLEFLRTLNRSPDAENICKMRIKVRNDLGFAHLLPNI